MFCCCVDLSVHFILRTIGIRTMSLVAIGACLFTITSMFSFQDGPMTWDASRVAAAIPSGVGFLGAGLIWKSNSKYCMLPTDCAI